MQVKLSLREGSSHAESNSEDVKAHVMDVNEHPPCLSGEVGASEDTRFVGALESGLEPASPGRLDGQYDGTASRCPE